MASPKVVFNIKFTYAFNRKEGKYDKDKINKTKRKIENKFNYFSNEEKRVLHLVDYYTGKINKNNTMNLVLENGKYANLEDIEKRKKDYLKYIEKSNLWQGVISFNNDYINENITLEELEQTIIKDVLPRLFKKMGFKSKDNMAYNISLHTDTDNYHFHFSFIEKKPNYILQNNKLVYRRKGQLTKEERDFMKNEVVLSIERKKYLTPLIINTNKEIDELKKYFKPDSKNFVLKNKSDLLLENNILKLGKLLNEKRNDSRRIKFNSIKDKEIIKLTKDIKKYLFNSKSELYEEKIKFKSSLEEINNYFYKLSKDNNINNYILNKDLIDNKNKYMDNYILNAIVNHANYIYMNKSKKYNLISEDDILREIILKEYKKNNKQTRYNILNNYLSNTIPSRKYQYKHKVINAIRNINSEMEDATKEFSKLFIQSNDYTK